MTGWHNLVQPDPDHQIGRGRAFHDHACTLKVEGIVSKSIDAPYAPGNRGLWLKVKCLNREEFVVGWTDRERGCVGVCRLPKRVAQNPFANLRELLRKSQFKEIPRPRGSPVSHRRIETDWGGGGSQPTAIRQDQGPLPTCAVTRRRIPDPMGRT